MIADKVEALLADKGYDADLIREELAKTKNRGRHPEQKQLAQSCRAPVQQTQELATHRQSI